MDRFKRFLRQLAWVVGILLGLILLAWIWAGFYFGYWLPPDKGSDFRTVAALEALEMPIHYPKGYVRRACEGDGATPENYQCWRLEPEGGRECRWWRLENCYAFSMADFVLDDPDKLGKVMDAVMHPCPYLLRQHEYSASYMREDCQKPEAMWHTPIILIFKGKDRTIRMRID